MSQSLFSEPLSKADMDHIIHRCQAESNLRVTPTEVNDYYAAFAEFDRDNSNTVRRYPNSKIRKTHSNIRFTDLHLRAGKRHEVPGRESNFHGAGGEWEWCNGGAITIRIRLSSYGAVLMGLSSSDKNVLIPP